MLKENGGSPPHVCVLIDRCRAAYSDARTTSTEYIRWDTRSSEPHLARTASLR